MSEFIEINKEEMRRLSERVGSTVREFKGFGYKVTITDTDGVRGIDAIPDDPLYQPGIVMDRNGNGFMEFSTIMPITEKDLPKFLDGIENALNILKHIKELL